MCYETREFVEKNKDELHASLEMVLEESRLNVFTSSSLVVSKDIRTQ